MKANLPQVQEAEMSFLEHLEELRWHIIRSFAAIAVISVIAFLSKSFVFETLILSPKSADFLTYKAFCGLSNFLHLEGMLCFQPVNFQVINLEMMGQFLIHLKVAVTIGFVLAFPYFFWEMWRFISPGLKAEEAQYSGLIVLSSSLLFMIGVSFGYFVLSPFSINFFASYSISPTVVNNIALASYISIITTLVLASGIMFELPIVVYFLSKLGLLTPEIMRSHRKHAVVVILLVAAIITPADIASQILVSIPVYFLYEISILVSAIVAKNMELSH